MAILDDNARAEVWAAFMRAHADKCPSLLKAELRAAVNAADDWLEANKASFNSALPASAQAMSIEFKGILLAAVALKKAGV